MKLVKDMKLYYVNKFTFDLEEATVYEVFDDGFSVLFYIGDRLCCVRLNNDALGTRFYTSRENAALVQRGKLIAERMSFDEFADSEGFSPSAPSHRKHRPLRDVVLECAECGRKFVFTVEEQEFYKQKNLSAPRTCSPECRERRRADFKQKEEQKALRKSMEPSVPYRTGSVAKNSVRVTGGVVNEITYLIYLEEHYPELFPELYDIMKLNDEVQ